MSFSTEVKNELTDQTMVSDCCRHAEAYGMLLFGRSFSQTSISLAAENTTVSEHYASAIAEVTGVCPQQSNPSGKMSIVSVRTAAERRAVLAAFGHEAGELSLRINRANFMNDCCFHAFLRGVFLSCGSISSPEKSYHLEFVVPFMKLSNDLLSFLSELGCSPKHVVRKSYHVIYFKDSESIEDVLTMMGATRATLELISVKVGKDLRNHTNRRVNFETANIDRAVDAGTRQLDAIRKIDRLHRMESLPPGLRKIAKVRMDNPGASLMELEELMDGELSRSGINHRLKRLEQIADELE